MNLYDKNVLLVGLGLQGGGVSTVKWLVKQGAKVTVTDLKTKKQLTKSLQALKNLPITYQLGKHPLNILQGKDLIVQNPGVPNEAPLIKKALAGRLPIENEASLFFKACPAPIMAVTGSKGKSTVVAWLGKIFSLYNKRTIIAGNIKDRLMLEELVRIKSNTPVILELSSWHLEGLARWRLSPDFALITNILPDHMNRYPNFSDYVQAKENIYRFQKPNDIVILNYDNQATRKLSSHVPSDLFCYSTSPMVTNGCYLKKGFAWCRINKKSKKLFNISIIKLVGHHNLENALAAATLSFIAGVPIKYIKQGISEFKGLHSRLELIASQNGVKYYNDTTATVPDATQAALNSFINIPITLIAGGSDKNLSYRILAKKIVQRVNYLILLPGTASAKLLKELTAKYKVQIVPNMRQAVKYAAKITPKGGVVLMSPAAASFGLFINEWDRGEQFIKAVKSLD
ncbi:MAG: UDP-N-acetylmuramoyl-L-alanine--D-glutamate ligase [Patescibacteria group bacterium]